MDYQNFSLSDFIADEYFQDWVLRPDDASSLFWTKWVSENQEKKYIIEQAQKVLLNINFKEDFPANQQVENALAKNLDEIAAIEKRNEAAKLIRLHTYRKLARIAAVFIGGLLILSFTVFFEKRVWRRQRNF